jgi:hypothetical protein
MVPRGFGHADPGVQNRYMFFYMPRGSGIADPKKIFSMMTRGSGEYGSGRQNR